MIPDNIKGFFQGLSIVDLKRSVLAPLIQACFWFSLPCLLFLALIPKEFRFYVLLLATMPVLLLSIVTLTLLCIDRNRLHTEEHLEKRQAMEIVESKSDGLVTNASDLVNMVNPEPSSKALPIDYKGADNGK